MSTFFDESIAICGFIFRYYGCSYLQISFFLKNGFVSGGGIWLAIRPILRKTVLRQPIKCRRCWKKPFYRKTVSVNSYSHNNSEVSFSRSRMTKAIAIPHDSRVKSKTILWNDMFWKSSWHLDVAVIFFKSKCHFLLSPCTMPLSLAFLKTKLKKGCSGEFLGKAIE